jgi:hypothetical protein
MAAPADPIPRGAIKRFREYLNALPQTVRHRHGPYHQRSRPYGDYLYAQDRERFLVNLREWLAEKSTHA